MINGVKPWDGDYPFDYNEDLITNLEWRLIKQLADCTPVNWMQELVAGNVDLLTTFAVLALHRNGRIRPGDARSVFDRFDDLPALAGGHLVLDLGIAETDEDDTPPLASSNGNETSSGTELPTSLDLPGSPDGTPEWVTSEFDAATSTT